MSRNFFSGCSMPNTFSSIFVPKHRLSNSETAGEKSDKLSLVSECISLLCGWDKHKKKFVCEKIDNKQIKCIYPDLFFFPQVMTSYDLKTFFLLIIISLVLNQTWIAVYMMVICAHPGFASRICPMVSAIGGFAGGFLVPRPQMPAGWVKNYRLH